MRSLFVDDILGAKPSHRYFEKAVYRQRHENQIERFGPQGKDYKKVFDWYHPNKRHEEPIERKNFPVKILNYSYTSSSAHNPEQLSRSMILKRQKQPIVANKVTELSPRMNQSSILSGSAERSLSDSLPNIKDNPYFPHMYIDKNSGQKNKWRGTRHWISQQRNSILIPKQSQTVAKNFKR